MLTTIKWKKREWDGPLQYKDEDDEIMMLPTDMALLSDTSFRPIVDEYSRDKDAFYRDFAVSFGKLLELGFAGTKL